MRQTMKQFYIRLVALAAALLLSSAGLALARGFIFMPSIIRSKRRKK